MNVQAQQHPDGVAEVTNCADPAYITVITGIEPDVLTKRFRLQDGNLEKESGGILVSGRAETRQVSNLEDFAALLSGLGPNQALAYGVTGFQARDLVTEKEWKRRGCPQDPIPRTKEHFDWPESPGVLVIDYDPVDDKRVLEGEELIALLRSAVPALEHVELLWWPSASSFIYHKDSGQEVQGLRGQRVYVMVEDARDIPRAGEVIFDRLWLGGHGEIKVSKSGALLERAPVDRMVWQTNRLDFAAGSMCEPPLEQRRGEPTLIPGDRKMLDSTRDVADLTEVEKRTLNAIRTQARAENRSEAAEARRAWVDGRVEDLVAPDAAPDVRAAKRLELERALDEQHLPQDFKLHVQLNGEVQEVSVAEVLRDPERFHRANTRDPIEPEYDGGRLVGMLLLDGPKKVLHSFARGATTYALSDGVVRVRIGSGKLARAVDDTIELLRDQGDVFDRGDSMVHVTDDRLRVLDRYGLDQYLGGLIQYQRPGTKGTWVDSNAPADLSKRILSSAASRKLKPLLGVITAPTLRADGSLLNQPGYDRVAQLYLYLDGNDAPEVPEAPDLATVNQAVDTLMMPFREFPFAERVDKSVLLAALLTGSVRRVLPEAPAFGFDAPVPGSGKTLLASAVSALATGEDPSVFPHVDSKDDEEVRKRLFSTFAAGSGALLWDNILGQFDSASLAAALTRPTFSDRVLGRSETRTVPSRVMVLLTGNNLTITGDMTRRVLVCRVDPRIEEAARREFAFDPLAYVRENRQRLIAACLTILRGWLSRGSDRCSGSMASFEMWNDWIRQAVAWIGREVAPGDYVDPLDALERSMSKDTSLQDVGALVDALWRLFGDQSFLAKEVVDYAKGFSRTVMPRPGASVHAAMTTPCPDELRDVLEQFGDKTAKSPTALGKVLHYHEGKIVDGLVLRSERDTHRKTKRWRIEKEG